VILRPCDWHFALFGKLLASPTDGRPVTKWPEPDEAFLDVVRAIRVSAAEQGGPDFWLLAYYFRLPLARPLLARAAALRRRGAGAA
jgi:hypothetical protein